MIRAVNDTNVWLGSILWRGAAYQVRIRAESGEYTAVTSHPILHELMRVLRTYFNMSDEDAFSWWLILTELCEVVPIASQLNVVERDPDDNKFIECAVDGQCQYIISKDRDLLDLVSYQDIRIISVNEFLQILGEPA
jgi:uncharacterized protein